jgi:hypothetical protein
MQVLIVVQPFWSVLHCWSEVPAHWYCPGVHVGGVQVPPIALQSAGVAHVITLSQPV